MNAFIEEVKPGAVEGMRKSKILASLTIAQAILESGWGKSGLATKAKNLFGIKGKGTAGSAKFPTQEWNGTKMETVQADFRKYRSWAESIEDHAALLAGAARYANLIGVTDYRTAARLIWKDGYATDPAYPEKLVQIIEENRLYEIDQVVLNDTHTDAQVAPWAEDARDQLMKLGITDGSRPTDPATRQEVWVMISKALGGGGS